MNYLFTDEKVEKLIDIIGSLDEDIKNIIDTEYANYTSDDLINQFNINSKEFLEYLNLLSVIHKKTKECNFEIYIKRLETARKSDSSLPIGIFCSTALEHIKNIFEKNQMFFLNLRIPDVEIKQIGIDTSNVLSSSFFKSLWKSELTENERNQIMDNVIELTSIAAAYFINEFYNKAQE